MRLSQAWTIARHDLSLLRTRRSVLASIVALPLGVAFGFPALVHYILVTTPSIPVIGLIDLLGAFSFWFAIGGALLPSGIASYSIVGEKLEKSLEPLLASPTTDSEILFGKVLAALVPTLGAVWVGGFLYMVLMDQVTKVRFGYLYYPNAEIGVILGILTPLVSLVAVELSVVVSSRVNDVRSAQQISSVLFLPFLLLYVFGEAGIIPLDTIHLLEISGIFALVALGLFELSRKTFGREEILTRWK